VTHGELGIASNYSLSLTHTFFSDMQLNENKTRGRSGPNKTHKCKDNRYAP
jgi:hypothetical protein